MQVTTKQLKSAGHSLGGDVPAEMVSTSMHTKTATSVGKQDTFWS